MSLVNWLEEHILTCPIKEVTGVECPGCGMQRASILLLRGELAESFLMYPPLIPVLITLLLLCWQLIAKRPTGGKLVLWSFVIAMSFVVISYVFNQLDFHHQFHHHNS